MKKQYAPYGNNCKCCVPDTQKEASCAKLHEECNQTELLYFEATLGTGWWKIHANKHLYKYD